MNELDTYLTRSECSNLTSWKKEVLRRYVRRFNTDYPIGRRLANGLMKINARHFNYDLVSQDFINWLYYY